MKIFFMIATLFVTTIALSQDSQSLKNMNPKSVTCKLTTPELQERKKTVIAELKALLLEKKELPNGMRYKFSNDDAMIDRVTDFIKTERLCCDFFDFTLSIDSISGFLWLELTGPAGTKEFITDEIGF